MSNTRGQGPGVVRGLTELASEYGADLILVTRGEKPHAAAQWARHQIVTKTDISSAWRFEERANRSLVTCAHRLADAAIESQLVLFIGAGVSASAGAPVWSELLARIARQSGVSHSAVARLAKKDLRDQATLIERRLRENGSDMKSEVAAELQKTARYSLQHALLASMPSQEAITTNFDCLFEEASRSAGRQLAILPTRPSPKGGRWLLKLHGSADAAKNIVLTRADFLDMPKKYGALMGLVQGMLLMRHMVFVGYSLQDEDFQELLHEVRVARGEGCESIGRGTVLTLFEDPLDREIWAEDLDVIPMISGVRNLPSTADAARQLEIFLDLVSFLSSTSAAFFLDRTYKGLADKEEELREALAGISSMVRGSPKRSVGFVVEQFLGTLGATRATRDTR